MFTPALDLILNSADTRVLLSRDGNQVVSGTSRIARLIRNDGGRARVCLCDPSQNGNRSFDYVDLSTATVRMAIGAPDSVPSTGTFPLAVSNPEHALGFSQPLVVGKRYLITSFESGDSFLNVGAASNASGVIFIATGTTPTTASNGSILQEITADIAIDATADAVEDALNATATITALGGVTVTRPTLGTYQVKFAGAYGAQNPLSGPINADMSPLSVVSVSRVQIGTSTLHEVQLIRLIAVPYCFATLSTAFPVAAATVTEIQPATSTFPATKRLTIDPGAYAGHLNLTLDGAKFMMQFDAGKAEAQFLAGANIRLERVSNTEWDFSGVEPAQTVALSVDSVDALQVPIGVTGNISLNTVGLAQAFANTTATVLRLTLEVEIQFAGQDPQTVYQAPVDIARDVIDLNSIVPPTMMGLQFVASNFAEAPFWTYTNTITALRGGPNSLESYDTTGIEADSLITFHVGNSPNTFRYVAGAADSGDPDGEVQPLDNGSFHWQKAGL